MDFSQKKIIDKASNSFIGFLIITIIPTFSFYVSYLEGFKISIMGLLIVFLIFFILYLFVKIIDIKNKIIALKEYRDFESLSVINFFNTEIKKLNDRLILTEKEVKLKSTKRLNENEKNLFKETKKNRDEKIISYNKNFQKWDTPPYGVNNQTTNFKKINYKQ